MSWAAFRIPKNIWCIKNKFIDSIRSYANKSSHSGMTSFLFILPEEITYHHYHTPATYTINTYRQLCKSVFHWSRNHSAFTLQQHYLVWLFESLHRIAWISFFCFSLFFSLPFHVCTLKVIMLSRISSTAVYQII